MLNDRLKKLRLSRGLTLQQVGEHFGISKSSVANWEKGINQPDPRKLEGLADFFNTSVEYLITGRPSTSSENNDTLLNQVPFVSWEELSNYRQDLTRPRVPALYTIPSDKAFATRTVGISSIDWKPGPIPTGAIVFVEPNKTPSQGNLVLLLDSSNSPTIAELIKSEDKNNFLIYLYNSNSFKELKNINKILGVLVEWRISAKL